MTKPGTKANKVWRHNAAIGQATWSIKALQSMLTLDTLTAETRTQVHTTLENLQSLRTLLSSRLDQKE